MTDLWLAGVSKAGGAVCNSEEIIAETRLHSANLCARTRFRAPLVGYNEYRCGDHCLGKKLGRIGRQIAACVRAAKLRWPGCVPSPRLGDSGAAATAAHRGKSVSQLTKTA
jgi:hypothetical protein